MKASGTSPSQSPSRSARDSASCGCIRSRMALTMHCSVLEESSLKASSDTTLILPFPFSPSSSMQLSMAFAISGITLRLLTSIAMSLWRSPLSSSSFTRITTFSSIVTGAAVSSPFKGINSMTTCPRGSFPLGISCATSLYARFSSSALSSENCLTFSTSICATASKNALLNSITFLSER